MKSDIGLPEILGLTPERFGRLLGTVQLEWNYYCEKQWLPRKNFKTVETGLCHQPSQSGCIFLKCFRGPNKLVGSVKALAFEMIHRRNRGRLTHASVPISAGKWKSSIMTRWFEFKTSRAANNLCNQHRIYFDVQKQGWEGSFTSGKHHASLKYLISVIFAMLFKHIRELKVPHAKSIVDTHAVDIIFQRKVKHSLERCPCYPCMRSSMCHSAFPWWWQPVLQMHASFLVYLAHCIWFSCDFLLESFYWWLGRNF